MFDQEAFVEWLATRPPEIQLLAEKYPPTTLITIKGEAHYMVGYDEGGSLLVSTTNPDEDYDKAVGSLEWICPSCLDRHV